MNSYLAGSKLKKTVVMLFVFLFFGTWLAYMLWADRIARRVVLMLWVPEWTTYLVIGAVFGLVFAGKAYFYGRNGSAKRIGRYFFDGFWLGFILSFHVYDVCVYLLPGDVIQYETEYEITVPGPVVGKFGRCEAGLGIKDSHTQRWIRLCVTQSELSEQIKKGMEAVWVRAYTNKIGSYIIQYQFVYK